MGLDEFLISRERTPGRLVPPGGALDDFLVAPPTLPEPVEAEGRVEDAPLVGTTPRPKAPAAATTAFEPTRPIAVDGSAVADLAIIAPPTIDEPSPAGWPREFVDDAVLDPMDLVSPHAAPLGADPDPRRTPEFGTPSPTLPDPFAVPARSGPRDEPADGLGAAADEALERLARVAERLERAVERLDPPPPSIGSRPRTFRGRIDG
ncbi:hypothetical protein [Planctomyces sp. SH-PL62]|uniref:hypothetical protein n=1 Tax=Planctomyces sp. SH-PL62 TaxID=1636152 RepID=UPI00078EF389|nr:hypothetical protein [Planctomyces sp. SH-PL62]AMV37369.1 hypothetical protein VT85_08040 [Planctomyces sp. SH-PL62]